MSLVTIDRANHTKMKSHYRIRDDQHKRANRNFAGLPSDSEDEDEKEEDSVSTTSSLQDEAYFEHSKILFNKNAKVKTNVPLPSDDSDEDDDEDDEEDDDDQDPSTKHPLSKTVYKRSSDQDVLYRNNRSAPSLPHQFDKHHAELNPPQAQPQPHTKSGHRSASTEDIKRLNHPASNKHHSHPSHYQYHPSQKQVRMATMSGMDLLIQREQEKAEAKRQKPKINPGKAKIEGLLGRLPEPGAHNINFQQMQQQAMMSVSPTPSHSMHRNKRLNKSQASFYSLQSQSTFFPPMPSIPTQPSPPMFDYRNRPHYSMPMSHPSTYFMINQQTISRSGSPMSLSAKQPIISDNNKQQRAPI